MLLAISLRLVISKFTVFRQIYRVGRAVALDDQSEISFRSLKGLCCDVVAINFY